MLCDTINQHQINVLSGGGDLDVYKRQDKSIRAGRNGQYKRIIQESLSLIHIFVMKRSEGLKPLQKIIGQFIITGVFAYYLLNSKAVGTSMLIPFTGGFENGLYIDLGIFFVPFLFFVVLGTDNGVNFTDGLDGLCTSVTILVATFLTVVALGERAGISPITGAVVGSLLGFLLFNVYPALSLIHI